MKSHSNTLHWMLRLSLFCFSSKSHLCAAIYENVTSGFWAKNAYLPVNPHSEALFYVLPSVILFLCFSVLLALRLPRSGKKELILVLFVRLFDLCLFGFVGFLFLLVSGKSFGLWLWHSLDFSLTFFFMFAETIYIRNILQADSEGFDQMCGRTALLWRLLSAGAPKASFNPCPTEPGYVLPLQTV